MEKVLTYVYYRGTEIPGLGMAAPDPDRYMENLRRIVEGGYFQVVTYAGQMNTTCGGTEDFGPHYGFIILADKETTKKILSVIRYDISESFLMDTMEKLDKDLNTFEDWMAAVG